MLAWNWFLYQDLQGLSNKKVVTDPLEMKWEGDICLGSSPLILLLDLPLSFSSFIKYLPLSQKPSFSKPISHSYCTFLSHRIISFYSSLILLILFVCTSLSTFIFYINVFSRWGWMSVTFQLPLSLTLMELFFKSLIFLFICW